MRGVLIILVIIWLLDLFRVPALAVLHRPLTTFLGHGITAWEILVFIVLSLVLEALPTPFRQIGFLMVVLWALSIMGIIAVSGLSNLLMLALFIGLAVSLSGKQ